MQWSCKWNVLQYQSQCIQEFSIFIITILFKNINFVIRRLNQRIEFLNSDTSFAVRKFVQKKQTGGRPKSVINEDAIKLLRQQGYNWTDISKIFEISAKTLSRRRKENNIQDTIQQYSNLTDDELDRIVKQIFKKYGSSDDFQIMTKRPLTPSQQEIKENHRARSAKMRVIVRKDLK